jgi:hypothetical protein
MPTQHTVLHLKHNLPLAGRLLLLFVSRHTDFTLQFTLAFTTLSVFIRCGGRTLCAWPSQWHLPHTCIICPCRMSFVCALKTELCFESFSCQGGFYEGLWITPDRSMRCRTGTQMTRPLPFNAGIKSLCATLLLEPCISLIHAWKANKYTNY